MYKHKDLNVNVFTASNFKKKIYHNYLLCWYIKYVILYSRTKVATIDEKKRKKKV